MIPVPGSWVLMVFRYVPSNPKSPQSGTYDIPCSVDPEKRNCSTRYACSGIAQSLSRDEACQVRKLGSSRGFPSEGIAFMGHRPVHAVIHAVPRIYSSIGEIVCGDVIID